MLYFLILNCITLSGNLLIIYGRYDKDLKHMKITAAQFNWNQLYKMYFVYNNYLKKEYPLLTHCC